MEWTYIDSHSPSPFSDPRHLWDPVIHLHGEIRGHLVHVRNTNYRLVNHAQLCLD
jgi:hypothetical protein